MSEAEWEYGFDAAADGIPGIMYVTRNALLADTLKAGRPGATLYRRPVPAQDWQEVPGKGAGR